MLLQAERSKAGFPAGYGVRLIVRTCFVALVLLGARASGREKPVP